MSPHLDDAILSCGGQIYDKVQAGGLVLIATVTAGDPKESEISPFARTLHQRWQTPAEAVSIRREEDRRACEYLGADFLHWNLLDCIYRQDAQTGQHMYQTEESLFGSIHWADIETSQFLKRLITDLPRYEQLVVPLAIGNHVDHRLCRQAAEDVCTPANITYYEDYPYSQSDNMDENQFPEAGTWQSSVIHLSEIALTSKLVAIAHYGSQLSTFFENQDDMVNKIHSFHEVVGGERLWRVKRSTN